MQSPFVSVTDRVQVYVDLFGFSEGWVKTIQKTISAMYRCRTGDACETYNAWGVGGVGLCFTTDKEHAKKVQQKACQLLNLAMKTYRKF